MTESPYSSIKGVGKITLNKLLIEYDGTEDIARQTPKSIAEKIGLSEKLSGEIIAMALSLKYYINYIKSAIDRSSLY